MLIIKILSGIAFMGSAAWFIALPDYEPAITIFTSLSAFIAAWIGDKKLKRQAIQNQTIAKNGIGTSKYRSCSIRISSPIIPIHTRWPLSRQSKKPSVIFDIDISMRISYVI